MADGGHSKAQSLVLRIIFIFMLLIAVENQVAVTAWHTRLRQILLADMTSTLQEHFPKTILVYVIFILVSDAYRFIRSFMVERILFNVRLGFFRLLRFFWSFDLVRGQIFYFNFGLSIVRCFVLFFL